MKLLSYKFLIVIIYLISTTTSFSEEINIKNLVIHEQKKKLEKVTFFDVNRKIIDLSEFKGNLIIVNFWATWCAPCREEMPSLDKLQSLDELKELKIIPINVGQEKIEKSINFFSDLKIQNLEIYYDDTINLAKKFSLRGLPTSIIIDRDGLEVARIVGSIDFTDENFVKWISKLN